MTLRDQLVRSALPLNAIRLALACVVIWAHSSPISGICCEPTVPFHPTITMGSAAVGGFFALSGLLVTMSAMRLSGEGFLLARARRIVPGYLFVLVATTLVLAPIIFVQMNGSLEGFALTGEKGALTYLLQHLFFGFFLQQNVNDIFYPGAWLNISLWTIVTEIRFYLVALILVQIGRRYGTTKVVGLALATTAALIAAQAANPDLVATVLPEYLPSFRIVPLFPFLCGAFLGTIAHRMRIDHGVGVIALLVLGIATVSPGVIFETVGYGALAIVIPYIASLLPTRPLRWFANDLSYGTYLWGVPVQQTLAFVGLNAYGLGPFIALSIACTLPFAMVSWFLVERRFLSAAARQRLQDAQGGS